MSRESKPWTDRRSVRPNLPSCNFAWRKESSSCTVYFLSGFAMNVPTIGWGGGVARLMTLKTICLRRTYPKAPCLYMTWKVDGTIPMYWWFNHGLPNQSTFRGVEAAIYFPDGMIYILRWSFGLTKKTSPIWGDEILFQPTDVSCWWSEIVKPGVSLVFESFTGDTVDGRNPTPLDMENIPLLKSQVVQDFFHQQYHRQHCWPGLAGGYRTWIQNSGSSPRFAGRFGGGGVFAGKRRVC